MNNDYRTFFYDFATEVGLTKPIGGLAATRSLAELFQIGKDSYVLEVGCEVTIHLEEYFSYGLYVDRK